jgi:hypothetical protein
MGLPLADWVLGIAAAVAAFYVPWVFDQNWPSASAIRCPSMW